MKHWHLGLIGAVAITAAWCNLATAEEKPAAMQVAPKDAPPRLPAPMVMKPAPDAKPDAKPATASPHKANPPKKDDFISWDEMVKIIKANELQVVFQTHAREVTIKTKDGKTYKAIEPQIDLIFKVVKESGKPMPPMATE